jgi:DNA repair protein RecN (Recombination protein N)
MLIELKVTNFAIIENLHIQFRPGLNILTGETGAGKSVLLKSLSLLMGLKGSTESIRNGFQQASIEGSFDISTRADVLTRLQDLGIEVEENLLVVKRVLAEGKSRVYINGTLSTLNTLRDLVSPLIEVTGHFAPLIELTGQFDNRNLMSKAYHLDLVDQAAQTWDLRSRYHELYLKCKALEEKAQGLRKAEATGSQRLDFLIYQRDEIEKLDLKENEEQDIELETKKLKSAGRWLAFVESAEDVLMTGSDSAVDRINVILKKASELGTEDPQMAESVALLREAKSQIEEGLFGIRKMVDNIDTDPSRLDQLSQRLSDLRKLQKKYGPKSQDILQALGSIRAEIHTLQNRDAELANVEKEIQQHQVTLKIWALELDKLRKKAASVLSSGVNDELGDLNMKGVQFCVRVANLSELTPTGSTEVEFMTRNSSKDEPRPLAKFASGGELSRVLLALKRVVGVSNQPRTYLFDEVDTGVSGPTAEKVGKKLQLIAKGQQVICITHLPQVAARGDFHFFIQKSSGGSVAMEVRELVGKSRVQEIARLISGETITKSSLTHAKELLHPSGSAVGSRAL